MRLRDAATFDFTHTLCRSDFRTMMTRDGPDGPSPGGRATPVRQFDCTPFDRDPDDVGVVVRPPEILYAFTWGPVHRLPNRPARIFSKWVDEGMRFAKERVYIRTADGIYQTRWESLVSFKAACPIPLLSVGQGLLVNVSRVRYTELRLSSGKKKLGFDVVAGPLSWANEWVQVSPGRLRDVRVAFGWHTPSRSSPSGAPPFADL